VPEGDTVADTAARLRADLAGATLQRADFRVPALATTSLVAWSVVDVRSRGKHVLIDLDRPDPPARYVLHSHLRMDGSWRTYPVGQRWTGGPGHLIRVALYTARTVAVGYHLHELALLTPADLDARLAHLGPDLLDPAADPSEAVRRLAADGDRPIAAALLDQRCLAGIGNVYQAELLFLRGLWPWTPVAAVDDLDALVRLAVRLMAANVGRATRSTTGSLRRGETSYVYGRSGQPCRRCGTLIRRAPMGERITFWCPHCQAQPASQP